MFLSVSNYVFTVIFLAEMAIKVSLTPLAGSVAHFYVSTYRNMPRQSTNSRIAPPGCSSGLLLWDADLPPVQLERSRWCVGVCVSGGHTGFSGLHWWEPDPGHPQSPASIAHTTPTQVRTGLGVCVCATCVFGWGVYKPSNPPT